MGKRLEVTVKDQDGNVSTYVCNGLIMALCQVSPYSIESQFVIQEVSGINAVSIAGKLTNAAIIQAQDELPKKLGKEVSDKLLNHALNSMAVALVRDEGGKK